MADAVVDRPTQRPGGSGDLELVRDALQRQPQAIEGLIARLKCLPRMIAAQNASLGRPLASQDLEDVVQNSIAALWSKLAQYDGRVRLETWVWRFGYLELLYALRRRRRSPVVLPREEERAAAAVGPAGPEFEDIHQGLERLDADASTLIHLRCFEDLSFEQIGTRLGLPTNTAKTRYYRALHRLRSWLSKERAPHSEGGAT
jgi:RNA polymerase sigma-70 factor, ECF subfamily